MIYLYSQIIEKHKYYVGIIIVHCEICMVAANLVSVKIIQYYNYSIPFIVLTSLFDI